MKFYTKKSSAVRAAKAKGLSPEQYTLVEGKHGDWGYRVVEEAPAEAPAPVEAEPEEVGIENDRPTTSAAIAAMVRSAVAAPAEAKPAKRTLVRLAKSSLRLPTKAVWQIADDMYAEAAAHGQEEPKRQAVIAECVRRGIAFGTARTQFQHWFATRNGTAK